jgi:hypothetical protein
MILSIKPNTWGYTVFLLILNLNYSHGLRSDN